MPHGNDAIWLGTRNDGIIELKADSFNLVKTEADEYYILHALYHSNTYNKHKYLIGTLRGGLILMDSTGKVLRIFTKSDGIADDAVYYNFTDREGNIWVAHENGISRLELNSNVTYLSEQHNITSLPFAINKFQNKLIVSVNTGVYSYDLSKHKENAETENTSTAEIYTQAPYRVWNIKNFGNKVFIAGQDLVLIKDETKETRLVDTMYAWNIEPVFGKKDKYWVFTQEGIRKLQLLENKWELSEVIKGFNLNSRYSDVDKRGNIWIAENNKGIYKLVPNDSLNFKRIHFFDKEHGIHHLSILRCFHMGNEVYVSAGKGVYIYDELNNYFHKLEVHPDLSDSIEHNITFRYPSPNDSAIWSHYNNQTAYFYKKNDSLFISTQEFRQLPRMNLFPTFYSDSSAIFIGYPKQLFRIDKSFKKDFNLNFNTLITGILSLKTDSLLRDEFHDYKHEQNLEIEYEHNSLRFSFAAPFYQNPEATEYSYMLVGEDLNWSPYSSSFYKDYTNLAEGIYTFKVKARNVFGIESEPSIIKIKVKPPIYRHPIAYFIYFVIVFLLIYAIVVFYTRKLKRTNLELEKRVEQRTVKIFEQKEALRKQQEELKKQNSELVKLSAIASETNNAVSVFNKKGKLEWVNTGYAKMFGYQIEELIDISIHDYFPEELVNRILNCKDGENHDISTELQRTTKEGEKIWVKSTFTALFNEVGQLASIIAIDTDISELKKAESIILSAKDEIQTQRDELIHQNKFIKMQNDDIQAAIRYAKTIQEAILPSQLLIDSFYDNFILYRPKDIVSGDFYWFHSLVLDKNLKLELANETLDFIELDNNTRLDFLIVADCTGHGVPGAFMSLIGSQLFTEIIIEKKNYLPSKILSLLNEEIRKALKQDITNNADGMDVGLCLMIQQKDYNSVIYAGSKRPFYFYKAVDNMIIKTKGDSCSIGGYYTRLDANFTDYMTQMHENDVIYLCSDGFIDQNGGNRKRYGSPRFESLLSENATKPMHVQKQNLLDELTDFMQDLPQRDDITVMGIKLKT